jgi:predicted metal-dependent HD superfamily phosphohydrolase
VELAIWFHDAVYDPRAKDNEARSAFLAAERLGPLGVPVVTVVRVMGLIRSTEHLATAKTPTDRDTAVILDADLAILGAAEDRYRRYAADIRKEYAFVPDEKYREGRAAVLQTFQSRPRIFHTQQLFEERDARARDNLGRELKDLEDGQLSI